MPRQAQPLHLTDAERRSLTTLLSTGSMPARSHTRARVLDLLDRGRSPAAIADTLGVSVATVFNTKRRYRTAGFDAVVHDRPRSGRPHTIDGEARAKLTALACSSAPDGHARWTLRLLADKAVELGFVDTISHTTVNEVLKKTL